MSLSSWYTFYPFHQHFAKDFINQALIRKALSTTRYGTVGVVTSLIRPSSIHHLCFSYWLFILKLVEVLWLNHVRSCSWPSDYIISRFAINGFYQYFGYILSKSIIDHVKFCSIRIFALFDSISTIQLPYIKSSHISHPPQVLVSSLSTTSFVMHPLCCSLYVIVNLSLYTAY